MLKLCKILFIVFIFLYKFEKFFILKLFFVFVCISMVCKFMVWNKNFRKKLIRSIILVEWLVKGKYKIFDDIM